MNTNNDVLRNYLKEKILVAAEASEMLGMTRQHITLLARKGVLTPIKNTPSGLLFLKDDITDFMKKRFFGNKENRAEVIGTGVTSDIVDYYRENLSGREDIETISVYYREENAISDGHYQAENLIHDGQLRAIKAPTLVLKYLDGDTFYFNGCNCGYSGTGPRGTQEILNDIGVPQEICEKVMQQISALYIYWTGEQWRYSFIERDYDSEYAMNYCSYGEYNNKIVYLQKPGCGVVSDNMTVEILDNLFKFVPNPSSITLYSKDMAIKTGHYVFSSFEPTYYQVVVTDESNRELWLSLPVNECKAIARQASIMEVFKRADIIFSANPHIKLPNFLKQILDERVLVHNFLIVNKDENEVEERKE